MKILFINPPRSPFNGILAHAPQEALKYIHKKLIGPPLGLMTIATAVQHDHDVYFLEMKGEYDLNPSAPDMLTMTKEWIDRCQPDLVATTVITSEFKMAMAILEHAKKLNPKIITVAGGLHATLCTNDFLNQSVDFVLPYQSTDAFRRLLVCLEQKQDPSQAGGILVQSLGLKGQSSPNHEIAQACSSYIVPDRELVKPWISTYRVGGNPFPSTYLFTSQGCPYSCSFCTIWPQFNGAWNHRSVQSIIDELKGIHDYPVVRFADANTVVNVPFIDQLFDRIESEGIKKTFIMDIRFDTVVENPKLIDKMARNGLKVVICGFESYRQEELEAYNKSSSAALISQAIDIFNQHDIMVRGNYVVPCDYQDDDFKALADYASGHKVVYAGYTVLTPMPGTPFYNQVKDSIIDHDLDKYNFFNAVLPTKLPVAEFYHRVGSLWIIKRGEEVI